MITVTFTQTNYHETIAFYLCASFEFQGCGLNTKVSSTWSKPPRSNREQCRNSVSTSTPSSLLVTKTTRKNLQTPLYQLMEDLSCKGCKLTREQCIFLFNSIPQETLYIPGFPGTPGGPVGPMDT